MNGKLNQNVPEMIANLESIHHNLAAIELHRMVYVPCSEDITASEMTPAIKRSCQKGTASEKCMLEMVKTDEDEIDLPRFDTLMYAVPYGALQRMATAPDISLWNRMSELVAAGSRQPQQHAVILNTDTVAAFRPRSRELYVEFLETIANYASLGVTAENPTMAQYDALSPKNQDVQRHHHHHHHHLQNNDSTAAANDDDTVDDDDDGLGSTLSTSIPLFSLYKRLFSFSVTSNAGADRSIPVKHKNIEANSTTLSKHMRKLTAERSESNRFDFTKRVEAKLLPSVPVTERTTATQAKNAREIALAKNEASAEKLKPREVLSRSYQIAKIDATIARLMMYRYDIISL